MNRSSRSATAARPPSAVTKPATLCGTDHTYCSALPSSYPTWPKLSGDTTTAGPGRKNPLQLRGTTDRVLGLNRFCQYCARFANSAAVAASPSESANREMAKSSIDHSRVIDASAIQPLRPNSRVNGA